MAMHRKLDRRSFLKRGATTVATLTLAPPLMAFRSGDSLFAPDAEAIPGWDAHDPASTLQVDHGPWAALLQKLHVTDEAGVARLRYGAAAVEDRANLDAYLARLAATPVAKLNRPEQFAYWTNLYNAETIRTVLAHYPVRSIQDIDTSPGLFSSGPWKAKTIRVGDASLSLDDVEHGILRPYFPDPRIHYAVNCAAIGCPNLRNEPFLAARLEQQLEEQAAAYVNDSRGVSFDREGRLVVSRIYAWFCEDFGDTEAGVLAHIRQYARPNLQRRLRGVSRIEDARYDWALNDAATAG